MMPSPSKLRLTRLTLVLVTCGAFAACSSADGPSLDPDEANCEIVCEKAAECISGSIDVGDCTSDCDADSDGDDVFTAKVEECAECVNDEACSEVSSCADDCLQIYVP